MAVGVGQNAAATAKTIALASCAIVTTIGVIAAVVVLSIISTFTANGSSTGYGEEYRCNAIMLKSIYTNTSSVFSNGTIADNPALSTLSTMAYKSITGTTYLTGCIVQNMNGWGPYNSSTTSKRRRRAVSVGLYSIGQMRCFYSTACADVADRGKYSNASSLSSCVKARLTATNSVFTQSSTGFTQWSPVPDSLTYSLVNSSLISYEAILIQSVYGVSPSKATSIAPNFGITGSTLSYLAAGCNYVAPLSQTAIAAIIANQYTLTTTAPSSTQSGG